MLLRCGVFGDLYSDVSLMTLQDFPTSNLVMEPREQIVAKRIMELCKSRSQEWANSKAERLVAAAQRNPFQKDIES